MSILKHFCVSPFQKSAKSRGTTLPSQCFSRLPHTQNGSRRAFTPSTASIPAMSRTILLPSPLTTAQARHEHTTCPHKHTKPSQLPTAKILPHLPCSHFTSETSLSWALHTSPSPPSQPHLKKFPCKEQGILCLTSTLLCHLLSSTLQPLCIPKRREAAQVVPAVMAVTAQQHLTALRGSPEPILHL